MSKLPDPQYVRPEATDPAEIHFRKAWQLRKDKQFEKAVDEFRESLKHQPDKAATHFNLALVLDILGKGEEAFSHATTAVALFEEGGGPSKTATALKLAGKIKEKYDLPTD